MQRRASIPHGNILMHGEFDCGPWLVTLDLPTLRPRGSGHPDAGCPGTRQRERAGAGRRPGGVDIVNQQHIAVPHPGRIGDKKSAAQIAPALVQAQACLTLSRALARQNPRGKFALPVRTETAHGSRRRARQQLRLVEATRFTSRLEERNRNNQHRLWQIRNCRDPGSDKYPQLLGYGLPSLVLEQVQ